MGRRVKLLLNSSYGVRTRLRRVQPDQVREAERAHGVGATLDHGGVDVLRGGEAGLEHADG